MNLPELQIGHYETSLIAYLVASYPRPFSACRLVAEGMPQFGVGKLATVKAVYTLQLLRLVRYRRGYLSLTKAGEIAMADAIAQTHSIH